MNIRAVLPALIASAACLVATIPAGSAEPPVETKEHRDARMAWWREARFGMFIHWGVYSTLGGEWNGKSTWTGGEWIMNGLEIPVAEYTKLPARFNPVKFNATEWVKLAKAAGMKYIIITAKHHDGFAMFKTAASPFNIVDASPFKRDILKELADACDKADIKLGFYYSQAQDWTHPGGAAYKINNRPAAHWDPAQDGDMNQYINTIAVPQVRELLTNYGPKTPAVLWWDTPNGMTKENSLALDQTVNELRPDIITNNRLGGGIKGDTETPEQHIPPQGYPGRDWETCMTMNETWGYKSNDTKWKTAETLLRNLSDIASKGGNYLLNIGPDGQGAIPGPSVEALRQMGAWLRMNGEAIYGTGPTPFGAECGSYSATEKDKDGKPKFIPLNAWRCTTKPGKLYIHIFQWPDLGKFVLTGLTSKVTAAALLADLDRQPPTFTQENGVLTVNMPATSPDPNVAVLRLDIENAPR